MFFLQKLKSAINAPYVARLREGLGLILYALHGGKLVVTENTFEAISLVANWLNVESVIEKLPEIAGQLGIEYVTCDEEKLNTLYRSCSFDDIKPAKSAKGKANAISSPICQQFPCRVQLPLPSLPAMSQNLQNKLATKLHLTPATDANMSWHPVDNTGVF